MLVLRLGWEAVVVIEGVGDEEGGRFHVASLKFQKSSKHIILISIEF